MPYIATVSKIQKEICYFPAKGQVINIQRKSGRNPDSDVGNVSIFPVKETSSLPSIINR